MPGARRGDRTLLYDFLGNALDELGDIKSELVRMDERDVGSVGEVNTRPCHGAGRRKK